MSFVSRQFRIKAATPIPGAMRIKAPMQITCAIRIKSALLITGEIQIKAANTNDWCNRDQISDPDHSYDPNQSNNLNPWCHTDHNSNAESLA
jgi:hypothetical protein